jgi:ABC transport system ATP-binding/permease protein
VGEADRACLACFQPVAPAVSESSDAVVGAASVERPEPLGLEIRFGRSRQIVSIPPEGATIGSTEAADVCIRADFLRPVHARVNSRPDGWELMPVGRGAVVTHHGREAAQVALLAGEIYRVSDGVGNSITLRPVLGRRHRLHDGALRAALPERGMSFLIGSDASCAVRLDHPLVQARHAALRRDDAGEVWLEDRATAAGTYVNGTRLRGRMRLTTNDILQIGPFSARIGAVTLEPIEQLPGVDIQAHGAGITVTAKSRAKRLLDGVSLHVTPASLTAVIGPSGAGKTTLMRMLSGQLAATEGVVAFNGVDVAHCRQSFNELIGFVPQDDVVHQELTVTEALDYQARLRLGASMSLDERQRRIDQLIGMLGLSGQADQLVRTLSGGQRKRTSIACELLKEPQLMFLDEPTSGLDPGLDKRMLLLLRLLADQGRTVLITTHSIAHLDVCDTLIIVGPGGRVMYAGDPNDAADWFGVDALGDVFALTETPEAAAAAAARWRDEAGPVVAPARAPALVASGRETARAPIGSPAWRAAVSAQARIFAGRQLRLISRDRAALAYLLLQGVVVALLTAFVAPKPFSWPINGSSATFVFGCAAVWFGMIGAVREIVKERAIWRREFMAGSNLVAYLAAKVAVLAGLALVQSLTLAIVLDMTLGLPRLSPLGASFVTVTMTLWLANLCGIAVGLLISTTSPNADRALSIVPYLLIAQLILCGVLFRLGAMTFVSWFTPARWSVSSLGGIAGLDPAALHQSAGMYPHSGIGLVGSWLALAVLAAACIAATTWSLARQGHSWQTGSDEPPPLLRGAVDHLVRKDGYG